MKLSSLAAAASVGFTILLAQGAVADAAEIKVVAGAATTGVLTELGPQFERATGHKVVIQFGLSGAFKRQIEAGEAFDIAIIDPTMLDDLIKQGKIVADTRADFARVGIGVAVRAGAPKPDIDSVDAFKRAMVNAKSVTYPPEGATGVHITKRSGPGSSIRFVPSCWNGALRCARACASCVPSCPAFSPRAATCSLRAWCA